MCYAHCRGRRHHIYKSARQRYRQRWIKRLIRALTLLTDPTSSDTDSDGIPDGVEINGAYGNPPQASDPRDNNTDDDAFDDGDEDPNGNGLVDPGETDPTRRRFGDEDNDGIQNWEENLSCTEWNVADTDFGGVNDGTSVTSVMEQTV